MQSGSVQHRESNGSRLQPEAHERAQQARPLIEERNREHSKERTREHKNSVPTHSKPNKVEQVESKKDQFAMKLKAVLDDKGGVKNIDVLPRFVCLMKRCNADPQKQALFVSALIRTDSGANEKRILALIVGTDEKESGECLNVLNEWLIDTASKGASVMLVSLLRALRTLPMTTKALIRTNIGKRVKKLQKYQTKEIKDQEDANADAAKVPRLAEQLVKRWTEQALAEQSVAKEVNAQQKHTIAPESDRPLKEPRVSKESTNASHLDTASSHAKSRVPANTHSQSSQHKTPKPPNLTCESKQTKTIVKLPQGNLRLPKRPLPTVEEDNPNKRRSIVML